ncbi:hypothetical protein AAT19DRAFT_11304 [Rhodotorula toruloides]|uniref:Uncharacterized protein n=1 Tax=Rhodotorula toruloides TaxID=5286 RepID=A0A2S9ZXR5_RHOTO|nr:hypothetical protein AAT19DRAFT_11304 [Rhodotorula toruloides]
MSTRPLLTPINPSSTMAARSPSPSSSSSGSGSGDDSAPATPSKDKMREWTFPRTGGGAAPSTGGARERQNEVDGIHGRSSSVAPSSARGHHSANGGRIQSPSSAKGGGDGASLDLRHRSNASLAFAPSSLSPPSTTLSLPRLLSSSPANSSPNSTPNVAKLVYSNIRRRSAHDLFFILVFGGAFLLFARALAGAGYDAPSSSELARAGEGAEVQLPPGFLPAEEVERKEEGEYLEEVHQRHGDSSHDVGEDWVRESPESLEDGHLEEEQCVLPLPYPISLERASGG